MARDPANEFSRSSRGPSVSATVDVGAQGAHDFCSLHRPVVAIDEDESVPSLPSGVDATVDNCSVQSPLPTKCEATADDGSVQLPLSPEGEAVEDGVRSPLSSNGEAAPDCDGVVNSPLGDGGVIGASASLGATARAMVVVSRLRGIVRAGHQRLAKRIGFGLSLCSVVHDVTHTIVFSMGVGGSGGRLCCEMTKVVSFSAFLLHIWLALSYDRRDRRLLWAHYTLLVVDRIISALFDQMRGRTMWAVACSLSAWTVVFVPLLGGGLHRLIRTSQNLGAATTDAAVQSAIVAFASSAIPILYFALNGLLCVGFSDLPAQDYCGTRISVNRTAIFALLGNAMTFVTLKIQPVSLDQVIQLDISAPQLVAFSFHGILLLFALVLHSQNETFAPATSAVEMVDKMAGLCLVISLTALITSIARKSGSNVHDTELPSDRRVLAHTTTTRRGRVMIPYRIIMVMFTIASLVLEVCPVGEMVRTAFSPLSFAAASFHIWVTMEEESLGGPVVLHYLAELGRAVFRCVIALLGGDLPRAVIMCVFAVVVFPGIFAALVRFRASVRSCGNVSAANCATASFVAFWGFVSAAFYLGADSLGESSQ